MKQTIGRYKVEKLIGKGSMGVVYSAFDPELTRTVAIKMFNELPRGVNFDARAQLFSEARSAGTLKHQNIVTIFDVVDDDPPYIVMDYVLGKSLDQLLKEEKVFNLEKSIYYISQVANALDYAHGKGVIHCDIKPGNLLIDEKEQKLYVLDFGIASIGAGDEQSNLVFGSPAYMSPEQIFPQHFGGKIDGRSDAFSLATVFFECITGVRPFEGNDISTIFTNIMEGNRKSLEKLMPSLPIQERKNLELAFNSYLSPDRNKRPETCLQMIEDICKILHIQIPLLNYSIIEPKYALQKVIGTKGIKRILGIKDLKTTNNSDEIIKYYTPVSQKIIRWSSIGGSVLLILCGVIWSISNPRINLVNDKILDENIEVSWMSFDNSPESLELTKKYLNIENSELIKILNDKKSSEVDIILALAKVREKTLKDLLPLVLTFCSNPIMRIKLAALKAVESLAQGLSESDENRLISVILNGIYDPAEEIRLITIKALPIKALTHAQRKQLALLSYSDQSNIVRELIHKELST
jgi:serine/threonine protein kinase